MPLSIRRVAQLKTPLEFSNYLKGLGVEIPFDEVLQPEGALSRTHSVQGHTIGNRFSILPMEGWDGTIDGRPTDLTIRRWKRFGESGAKLIWGGEAVAVCPEGRANPNQLMINKDRVDDLRALRKTLEESHLSLQSSVDDLLIGLQLTHSGRFARPEDKRLMRPQILYRHPVLDRKFGLAADYPVLTDSQIKELIQQFIHAGQLAYEAGYHFVDIKHCHGYLGHEFLSAVNRPGPYGGSLENRTRFLTEIVEGLAKTVPNLKIGVRWSAIDFVPFRRGEQTQGEPEPIQEQPYPFAFGGDGSGIGYKLDEPKQFLEVLRHLGIQLLCVTLGSPYYNPHIQRPAIFPPSDGYSPPEDPLVGVARQIEVTAALKSAAPEMTIVGSGYSYLQEWLPHVGQAVVDRGMADFIGLGRMVLSYPKLPLDTLSGKSLQRKLVCRTFSDCTTAPRNGIISGCYPLDPFYKSRPEFESLAAIKQAQHTALKT